MMVTLQAILDSIDYIEKHHQCKIILCSSDTYKELYSHVFEKNNLTIKWSAYVDSLSNDYFLLYDRDFYPHFVEILTKEERNIKEIIE